MSTPYAAYARQFTARLQARMHAQSYTSTVQRVMRRAETPLGTMAESQLSELSKLAAQHQRTFDPILKQRAIGILQSYPLKSTDEDPHFAFTMASLRYCAYFNAVQAPATFNLLNHVTRHTFLLDAFNVFQLILSLERLKHPQTKEILLIVLPRISEVAANFAVSEARLVLRCLSIEKILTAELSEKLVAVMIGGLEDMWLWELGNCVSVMPLMGSDAMAQRFLEAAGPRICQVLQDASAQRLFYRSKYVHEAPPTPAPEATAATDVRTATSVEKVAAQEADTQLRKFLLREQNAAMNLLTELISSVIHLSWAPRNVLNEIVRAAISWSEAQRLVPFSSGRRATEKADPAPAHGAAAAEETHVGDAAVKELFEVTDDGESTIASAQQREREAHLQALPQMSRRRLCECLQALHRTSYRHPSGLRILSSRVAASESPVDHVRAELLMHDVAIAIEAVAYFYETDCIPAVLSLLEEMETTMLSAMNTSILARSAASSLSAAGVLAVLSPEEVNVAEAVALRTLLSCTRLLSVAPTTASTPGKRGGCAEPSASVKVANTNALLVHAATLAASPLLQAYLRLAILQCRHQNLPEAEKRRFFAAAAHTLYSVASILQASEAAPRSGETTSSFEVRTSAVDAAMLQTLQSNVRELAPVVSTAANAHANLLPEGAAAEMRAALTVVQKHPAWMCDA